MVANNLMRWAKPVQGNGSQSAPENDAQSANRNCTNSNKVVVIADEVEKPKRKVRKLRQEGRTFNKDW